MKEIVRLKSLAVIIILSIAGCATKDTALVPQSGDESLGRGLTVEAPDLLESNVAVFPQMGHTQTVWAVEISPDNNYLISADTTNGFVNLWEIRSGRLVRTFWGHGEAVKSLAYSPDGKSFASGDSDGIIKIWSIESGKELHTLSGHSDLIHSIAYSPDGKHIVSASRDRTITI